MGKNQSASNLTNIIKQDGSGNIVFTSGSTTLATISTTGQLSGSTPALSASYAATSSYAANFNVSGTITATTLVVQTITSSVDFVTGSTRFGSTLANTHVFSGSVSMNPGGLFVSSSGLVGIGTTSPLGSATERTLHLSDGGAGFTTLYVTNGANTLRGIFAVSTPTSAIAIGTQTNTDLRLVTNDTEKMRILSNGNVGIGTTSPFNFGAGHKTLDVRGEGTGSIGAIFAGNSDRSAVLGFYINPSVSGVVGTSTNHPLSLVSNDVERIRIIGTGEVGINVTPTVGNRFWIRGSSTSGSDTSIFVQNSTPSTLFSVRNDGIVTKPLQPAFRAGRSSSYTPGANTVIVFNSTGGFGFNVGGHYSTSTGRFTAPISGVYNFTACVIWESVGNSQSMDDAFTINVNGSPAAYSFRRATYIANTTGIGGYYVDNATVLLNLTAGQYVEIFNRYNLTVHGNSNYCYFNGYLVG